jgi:hypothetical protein
MFARARSDFSEAVRELRTTPWIVAAAVHGIEYAFDRPGRRGGHRERGAMLAVVVAATAMPVRRASRANPNVLLRAE